MLDLTAHVLQQEHLKTTEGSNKLPSPCQRQCGGTTDTLRALMESHSEIIEGSTARYHLSLHLHLPESRGWSTQLAHTDAGVNPTEGLQLPVAPEKLISLLIELLCLVTAN